MSTETTTAPAPTTTAPNPSPAAATAPKTESSPFSALDTRARTLPVKEKPEPKEEPNPDDDKGELAKVFDDKPKEEKPVEAKPEAKPATTQKPQVEAPKVLREKLESTNKELETSRKELTTLREKIAEYDKKNIDTTALSKKLEDREKEYQEIKAERDAARYERSDEFKTKFEAPFAKAVGQAKAVVANLTITETDPATGEATQRKATWDDFADIYRMSPARAELEGKRLFGDNYMVVMRHLDKLRELDGEKAAALQEHQANATQRETQQIAERAQQREKVNQAWEMTNKDLIEANPDWYGERKEDEEGNALWKESLALVDQAYSGRDKLTFQQQVALDANIRLRAAAFPRILRENEQLKAQLAEINEKREQRESSLPGKVKKPGGGETNTESLDWRQDLHKSVDVVPG